MAPRLDALIDVELLVPDPLVIGRGARLRSGSRPTPTGTAPTTPASGSSPPSPLGRPGRASARPAATTSGMPARDLFERADAAQERVVVDPGAPTQVEIAVGVLPFLAAGIDPNRPDALRARRPLGELPALEAPEQMPEPFGRELLAALEDLPQVERAWLLRAGTAWTAGVQLAPDARARRLRRRPQSASRGGHRAPRLAAAAGRHRPPRAGAARACTTRRRRRSTSARASARASSVDIFGG